VDLYGTYIKSFAKLAQNNVILAWEINGSQKEFLRDRIRGGRIVTGYTQSPLFAEKWWKNDWHLYLCKVTIGNFVRWQMPERLI